MIGYDEGYADAIKNMNETINDLSDTISNLKDAIDGYRDKVWDLETLVETLQKQNNTHSDNVCLLLSEKEELFKTVEKLELELTKRML